ncbi:MAG: hypothetical protein ACUVQ4_00280 [bacterium]
MPLNSKSEILNSEQIAKLQTVNSKHYDLEKRTYLFAKRVNEYVTKLPKTISNIENGKQLVKFSRSVGANYKETNEGSV